MAYDIPGFDILERIGESCVTDVFKAYQQSLQRVVSIKVLKPDCAIADGEVRRFIDEAKHTARLNHPNIVSIYDAVEANPVSYLVMEHVDGPRVADLLTSGQPLSLSRALRIAEAIADALQHAWRELSMIHRNVTPRSMRIDADGAIKLAYVGISLRLDPLHPMVAATPGMIVGTPYYMSPEQAAGNDTLDFRCDMYALGASLYHMLTGRMPFGELSPTEAMEGQRHGYLPPPRQVNPTLPPGVISVMEKLMMRAPADRYASWDEVVSEVGKLSKGRIVIRKRASPVDCVIMPPPRARFAAIGGNGGKRQIVIRKHAPPEPEKPPTTRRRIRLVKRSA